MAAAAHLLVPDGVDGAVLALVMGDTGTYAPGYSDRAFRSVRSGMTQEDVRAILGEPLKAESVPELRPAGSVVWAYSASVRKGNFRVRSVVFGPEGRVLSTHAYYWID